MLRIHTLFFIFTYVCVAQTTTTINSSYTNPLTGSGGANIGFGSKNSRSFLGLNIIEHGRGINNTENSANIEGSKYLFKSWENKSKIWLNDNVFNLDSVNYNLENQRFEIKLSKDSIFIISPDKNIKMLEINFHLFKTYYNSRLGRNSFYEVLGENDNYSLLSNNYLKVEEGAIDPLTKTQITPKKYVPEKDYFVLIHNNTDQIINIKLKKSEILKLIDVSYENEFKNFVKKHRLKYNQISDVSKMLEYYYSIKS